MRSLSPQEFLRRATDIASFYGFSPAQTLLNQSARPRELRQTERPKVVEVCASCGAVRADRPLLFFYKNLAPRAVEEDVAEFNLEILGIGKSVAEAILLKTVHTILTEGGFSSPTIHINSLGDRDSLNRFARELGFYYRRRIEELSTACRAQLNKGISQMETCTDEKCREVHEEAPKPMNFLTEASRQHFMEVLEYLERMGLPYQLEETLRGPREYFSKTVFEIRHVPIAQKEVTIAVGGRYDDLARKVTGKKEMSALGASVFFKRKGLRLAQGGEGEKKRRARIYLIHIGAEAKLKSLDVLEMLRKARIPVYQDVASDTLSLQLSEAQTLKTPHIILMGHKEALENTVIVRDMMTRAQETVPITGLTLYLKKVFR